MKGEVLDKQDGISPLWVLLSSLITNNHDAYFFRVGIPCHSGNIINLYDSGSEHASRHMIQLHILNFLDQKYISGTVGRNNPNTKLEEIIQKYQSVCKKSEYQIIEIVIRDLVQAFLYCDLITSPRYYGLQKLHNVKLIESVSITDTGRYFLKYFRNYYEYLVYMKDGVELGNNPYGIEDCIEVTRFAPRYDNVYKFTKMIFDKEKDFLREMSGSQRKKFKNNFTLDGEPFVVALPVKNMIDYGNRFKNNQLDDNNVELVREIEKTINKFVKLKMEITNVGKKLFSK